MLKKILIPLDGSEHSLKIVGWATGLAHVLGAQIILFSVVDPEEIDLLWAGERNLESQDGSSANGSAVKTIYRNPAEIIGEAKERVKDDLTAAAAEIRAAGVDAIIQVESGSPAEEIVSAAHGLGIDLIAMATRRESALARGILGSVTDRVLHSTSIPVLSLYPGELDGFDGSNGPPKHVIVPLDGSALSENAVSPALEIAIAAGADIVFTETVRIPLYGVSAAGIEYGGGDYAGDFSVDAQKKEILNYLQGFVERAEASGLVAHANVRTGNASQQIGEVAAESEGSIIVMASRGAGGLRRWVLGSVADKVIRSARTPVIVVPHSTK